MPIDAEPPSEPVSYVSFNLKEQVGRISTWIEDSFLPPRRQESVRQQQNSTYNFVCLRRQSPNGNDPDQAPRNPYLSIQAKKDGGCQVQVCSLVFGKCILVSSYRANSHFFIRFGWMTWN